MTDPTIQSLGDELVALLSACDGVTPVEHPKWPKWYAERISTLCEAMQHARMVLERDF